MNGRVIHSFSPVPLAFHRLVLLALVAVLFGLLAMHSVATNSAPTAVESHAHTAVSATTSAPVAVQLASSEVFVDPGLLSVCGGANPLDCLMIGVMCTIGMMAVGIMMLIYRRSSSSFVPAALTRVSAVISQYVAPLRPPSLLVLSISRT